jgi:aryl-alcohol dehydrogenase-like predicted oxidoreductase
MSYGTDKWADWVLNEEEGLPMLKAAWDAGIQTWDTADVYSNVSDLYLHWLMYRVSPKFLLEKLSRSTTFPVKN